MPEPADRSPTVPAWPPGTVVTLVTAGTPPHAIPVSAAVPAGDRVLLGLARSRDSLARLRAEPHVALAVLAAGDVAVTLYGAATVLEEEIVGGVAAVEVAVSSVADHNRSSFVIESGVGWRWTDAEAQRRDGELRAALTRLAGGDER